MFLKSTVDRKSLRLAGIIVMNDSVVVFIKLIEHSCYTRTNKNMCKHEKQGLRAIVNRGMRLPGLNVLLK